MTATGSHCYFRFAARSTTGSQWHAIFVGSQWHLLSKCPQWSHCVEL